MKILQKGKLEKPTLYISSLKNSSRGLTNKIPLPLASALKSGHVQNSCETNAIPASPSTPLLRDNLRMNSSACKVLLLAIAKSIVLKPITFNSHLDEATSNYPNNISVTLFRCIDLNRMHLIKC